MKIICKNIYKTYSDLNSKSQNHVISNTSLSLDSGKSLAITGPSGVGKSTFLNVLSGLDYPDKGEIFFDNLCFSNLSYSEKSLFRLQNISLVFQSFNLLKDFNVLENIILPLRYKGFTKFQSTKIAIKCLDEANLLKNKDSSVSTLSGGEAQRVGIARAIAMNSKIILADEPTGNLDTDTSKLIIKNLIDICNYKNITLVIVSHDNNVISELNNRKNMSGGKLI
tara:strand:- start:6502 stop:7173 length:672 start_codon:yes stop_codon:yes gene_type:complete